MKIHQPDEDDGRHCCQPPVGGSSQQTNASSEHHDNLLSSSEARTPEEGTPNKSSGTDEFHKDVESTSNDHNNSKKSKLSSRGIHLREKSSQKHANPLVIEAEQEVPDNSTISTQTVDESNRPGAFRVPNTDEATIDVEEARGVIEAPIEADVLPPLEAHLAPTTSELADQIYQTLEERIEGLIAPHKHDTNTNDVRPDVKTGNEESQHDIPVSTTRAFCGTDKSKKFWRGIGLILFGIGVIIFAIVSTRGNDGDDGSIPSSSDLASTSSPTTGTTEANTFDQHERLFQLWDIIGAIISGDQSRDDFFRDAASYAYQALEWLANQDPVMYDFNGVSPQILVERYVLVLLYFMTHGSNWTNQLGFLGPTSVCDWFNNTPVDFGWGVVNGMGVVCVNGPFVRQLDLHRNNLTGPIPTQIGLLTNLNSRLSLSDNTLNGTIPTELALLANLRVLWLSMNMLSGTIPEDLGTRMTRLSNLSFHTNLLTGKLPDSLGSLTELTLMWGGLNSLEDNIPTQLGKLERMISLSLQENKFTGPIPSELGHMGGLNSLRLESNALSGTLPTELANLPSLTSLVLYDNSLTGIVDPGLFCFPNHLEYINFYADCLGNSPEIQCECCTYCCSTNGTNCEPNNS